MFFGDEFKALVSQEDPERGVGRGTPKKEGSHKQGKPAADSKKMAGKSGICDQHWHGIILTTFNHNLVLVSFISNCRILFYY